MIDSALSILPHFMSVSVPAFKWRNERGLGEGRHHRSGQELQPRGAESTSPV